MVDQAKFIRLKRIDCLWQNRLLTEIFLRTRAVNLYHFARVMTEDEGKQIRCVVDSVHGDVISVTRSINPGCKY